MNFELSPSTEPELTAASKPATGDDSDVTVISKKPPQQFCTGGFDWRKIGELLIGRQLGSFRLDSLLGVGGMGAVFQATDLQLHRQVAVKILNSTENDPEAERRFRVEAQSTARLDHQNIARVFHVGQDQGWNYIVLELVQGQTLRQLVTTKGPLSLKLAIHIFRQLASALDHAHQRNIIHRDIKPSNVLVSDDHSIKIVDMGLARIQRSVDSADHDAEEGMTLGTFDYIAPEQARDARQADQQSDLYSLGCTLYYALVRRPPFADGATLEKILSHSNSPRPSVLQSRPDLPLSMERLVHHMMAPRREDRIGTARELEQRLLDLRLEQGRVRRPAAMRRSADTSLRRVPLMFVGMTLALVLASLIWDGGWRESGVTLPDWSAQAPAFATAAEREPVAPVESEQGTEAPGILDNASTNSGGLNEPQAVSPSTTVVGRSPVPDNGLFARPSADKPFHFQTPDLFLPFLNRDGDALRNQVDWWRRPNPPGDEKGTSDPAFDRQIQRGNQTITDQRPTDATTAPREQITTIQVEPLELINAGASPTNNSGKPVPANVARVSSFAQAIDSLQQFPNVRRIELNFSGAYRVPTRVVLPSGLREIRAGEGHQPVLYFGGTGWADQLGARSCIQLESGNLEVVGVAFAWESKFINAGALFEIPEISRVTLKECSFQHVESSLPISTGTSDIPRSELATGSNFGANGSSIPAWIRIVPSSLPAFEGQKQGILTLSQCAMHGPIAGVELQSRQSMLLRWTDSLISTWGSVILVGSNTANSGTARFEIELERSSFFARRGILTVDFTRSRPAVEVSLFAQDCLMVATDLGIGLLHQQVVTDTESTLLTNRDQPSNLADVWPTLADSSLNFDGFNNMLVANVLWTLAAEDGRVSSSADAMQIRSARWFQQDSARYRSVNSVAATELSRLLQEPASNLIWTGMYGAIGQGSAEHGVSFAKLPKFPIIATPAATTRP